MKHTTCMRRLGAAAAIAAVAALGACSNDLLEVDNPAQLGDDFLQNTTSIPALTATAVSDFQRFYSDLAYAGAILSDEAITGHNFTQWQEFDLRLMDDQNSILDDIYEPVQIARGTSDLLIARLKELLPGYATDVRYAQTVAFSGYDHLLLGENFCEAPLEPNGPRKTSDELYQIAIDKFTEARTVATAATKDTNNVMTRANIINMARLGAARAHLNLGQKAQAITQATALLAANANFALFVQHNATNGYQNNPFFVATTGANHNLGVATPFRNLNDPRVRNRAGRTGHNQRTILFTPFQPESYEGWVTTGTGVGFEQGTDVRFASALEARYIVAEAEGLNQANLDFVNSRRAIGGQAALVLAGLTEADYQAALRDQRRRDFFLDGHRLGDLRRYIKLYSVNQFPTGTHEDAAYGQYGTATCYIPHIDEEIGQAP
jgi:hypothetical protein